MFKVVIFFSILLLSNLSISQEYTTYTKLGLGYVVDTVKSAKIDDPEEGKFDQKLYYGKYDDYTYTIETGIQTQGYSFGLLYTNIISQDKSSKFVHNPERAEIFGYKQYPFVGNTMFVLGTGFLIKYDNTIMVTNENGTFESKIHTLGMFIERVTARFGVVYQYEGYEIGLIHYSQWLTGKPFNDRFENQKTEILISYYF